MPVQARKYVPSDLPLVNFFGWTLGGFYLARYSHSPVGAFDEFVALAGLVWDFPTSCAWAARVFVTNKEARTHGISEVGLPSRLAGFKPILRQAASQPPIALPPRSSPSWWDVADPDASCTTTPCSTQAIELQNVEPFRPHSKSNRGVEGGRVGVIQMPPALPPSWCPTIQMFLPSFSGATPEYPGLLKYSLKLMTGVRFLRPLDVSVGGDVDVEEQGRRQGGGGELLEAVLGGRPLVCMAFENMVMEVQPPRAWSAPPVLQGKPLTVAGLQRGGGGG